MKKSMLALAMVASLGVAGCADPYDPGQRALGGAALGAGSGALIGGALGGGRGAAAGAILGGGVGAVGGAASTPNRPYYGNSGYYQQPVYAEPPPVYSRRYGY